MDALLKLKQLEYYIARKWPVFPIHWVEDGACSCNDPECKSPGKHPLTPNGLKNASIDADQIAAWHADYPSANWGMRTGNDGGAGIDVIDIDKKSGGLESWDSLRNEHPEPMETTTTITRNGGRHLWAMHPLDVDLRNSTSKVAPGIDIRANGGYVLVPPSVGYSFEIPPGAVGIMEFPTWVLERLPRKPTTTATAGVIHPAEENQALAMKALAMLKPERADNYEDWLNVGLALTELGDIGLTQWDLWSRQSEKYERGACAQKWATFKPDAGLTLGSLIHWAEEDSGQKFVSPGTRGAKPSAYVAALTEMGYRFSLNRMNDVTYLNEVRMTDPMRSTLLTELRENGYVARDVAEDAWTCEAAKHSFHPIADYLTSLKWDGRDHIGLLTQFFLDDDALFPVLLRRWLIGAVDRVMGQRPGIHHPMLVLDGKQGIGKSRFVWWLGSPLPAFYMTGPINTEDKDYLVYLCSKWIWEVEELGSTIRKADREALKGFISKEFVTVRKAYGHLDIAKTATASFIGTLNNEGGFLSDPTGNRRFRTCTLNTIDWAYANRCDVNMTWAQAVHLLRKGESWMLSPEEEARVQEVNAKFEVEDTLAYHFFKTYTIDHDDPEAFITVAEIISTLQSTDAIRGTEAGLANRLASILIREGVQKERATINGHRVRIWKGVRRLTITEPAKVVRENLT